MPILVEVLADYGFDLNVDNIDIAYAKPFEYDEYTGELGFLLLDNAMLMRLNTDNLDLYQKFKNNPMLRELELKSKWENAYNSSNDSLNTALWIIVVMVTAVLTIFYRKRVLSLFLLPYLAAVGGSLYILLLLDGGLSIFTTIGYFILTGLVVGFSNVLKELNVLNYQRVIRLLITIVVSTAGSFGLLMLSQTNFVSSTATVISSGLIIFAIVSILMNLPKKTKYD